MNEPCTICRDPNCYVRGGSIMSAYHYLEMLREAYEMNGTPKSDDVLMGLAHEEGE